MTAQIPENLHYEGQEHAMCEEPLSLYFCLAGIKPDFEASSTGLWRGYVGTWEILDGRLYLIGINGKLNNGSEATVATFFKNYKERVFAHWFSGILRLPRGKLLNYVHMGFDSTYEEDLLIAIDKGVVTKSEVRCNGESSDPNAPEGYRIGMMSMR